MKSVIIIAIAFVLFIPTSVHALEVNPEIVDISSSYYVEVVISGYLDYSQNSRLILTVTSPDNSKIDYDVRVTGEGPFSKTLTVTNEWDYGTYDVTGKYGDIDLGATSFVIEAPYDPRIGMKTSLESVVVEPVEEIVESVEEVTKEIEIIVTSDDAFTKKRNTLLSSLTNHGGISYRFELERDFTTEQNLENTFYELYKIIDNSSNKRIGDLRLYFGTNTWWDENALLQQDDVSGFENIIKIKMFVLHSSDPQTETIAEQNIDSFLSILVPEWDSDTLDVSSTEWLYSTLSNAPRNQENSRENQITVENKYIRLISDDLSSGSITIIVTENFDKTKSNYVTYTDPFLEEILNFEQESNSKGESVGLDESPVVTAIQTEPITLSEQSQSSFSEQLQTAGLVLSVIIVLSLYLLVKTGLYKSFGGIKLFSPYSFDGKRRAFNQQTKDAVLRLQDYKCKGCGITPQNWDFDHIGSRADNSIGNCQALCLDCHRNKTRYENR